MKGYQPKELKNKCFRCQKNIELFNKSKEKILELGIKEEVRKLCDDCLKNKE